MKTISIFFLFINALIASENEEMLFRAKLQLVLHSTIPMVAMEHVGDDEAITFLMMSIKRKFGSAADTETLSDIDKSIMSNISYTYTRSALEVTCQADNVKLATVIQDVCKQLKLILIVNSSAKFYFIPEDVIIDTEKYEKNGIIYVKK